MLRVTLAPDPDMEKPQPEVPPVVTEKRSAGFVTFSRATRFWRPIALSAATASSFCEVETAAAASAAVLKPPACEADVALAPEAATESCLAEMASAFARIASALAETAPSLAMIASALAWITAALSAATWAALAAELAVSP